jgi:hypothetical protein
MVKHLLQVVSILLFLFQLPAHSQTCGTGTVPVKIKIVPDSRPQDIYWEVVTQAGDTLAKGQSLGDSLCVPDSVCIKFMIHDRANNGLCCTNGIGYYELFYNHIRIGKNGKYTNQETTWMGCQKCQNPNQSQVKIYINPDNYPQETSWTLQKYPSGDTLAKGKINDDSICVPKGTCMRFTIRDSQGDGICCGFGQGDYSLYIDSVLVGSGGQFTFVDFVNIGCAAGTSCSNPINVQPGQFTSMYDDTWYKFVPDTAGNYQITTCDLANACSTKIWVYEYCQGLAFAEDNTATMAYSFEGCGQNAFLNAVLQKNQTYYIRIGDRLDNCSPDSIHWKLNFLGAIVGCKDSLSCTYNPLATVEDQTACLYNPDTACPDQPDLMVVSNLLRTSMRLDSLDNTDECTILEGCIKGYGKRYLVRFDTRIENIGNADYYIGKPPANINQPSNQWLWDPCHGHWHYKGYAEYILFDKNSNQIPAGFKAGFCVMDLNCSLGGGTAKYNCANQGVTAGCGDIYAAGLKCQWIDITEVDTGRYTLVVRVNWDNSPDKLGRVESNLVNNWGQVCLKITKNSTGRVFVTADPICNFYIDCEGVVLGPAKRDCEGVCKGSKIKGNMNADSTLSNSDLETYVQGALTGSLSSTSCVDLTGDNKINILDIAALQRCLENAPPENPTNHYTCDFPPIISSLGMAAFKIDTINLSQGYLDLSVRNTSDYVTAFQMKISGPDVDSIRWLGLGDSGTVWKAHTESGMLMGSLLHNRVNRGLDYKRFLRVYFDSTNSNQVCIDSIYAVQNHRNEATKMSKGPCLPLGVVTSASFGKIKPGLRIVPNPFSGQTTIEFPNDNGYPYRLVVRDMQGKVVWSQTDIRSSKILFQQKDLAPGMYLFQLKGLETINGKLLVE